MMENLYIFLEGWSRTVRKPGLKENNLSGKTIISCISDPNSIAFGGLYSSSMMHIWSPQIFYILFSVSCNIIHSLKFQYFFLFHFNCLWGMFLKKKVNVGWSIVLLLADCIKCLEMTQFVYTETRRSLKSRENKRC